MHASVFSKVNKAMANLIYLSLSPRNKQRRQHCPKQAVTNPKQTRQHLKKQTRHETNRDANTAQKQAVTNPKQHTLTATILFLDLNTRTIALCFHCEHCNNLSHKVPLLIYQNDNLLVKVPLCTKYSADNGTLRHFV